MKKAGVILGIIFVIAAIVVFIVSSKMGEKQEVENKPSDVTVTEVDKKANKTDKENKQQVNQQPNNQQQVNQQLNNQQQEVNDTQVVQQVAPQTQVVEKEVSSVKTINESDLSNSKGSHEVIAVIANKRVLLIDENTGGNDKKTLTYCFDVLTPDNKSIVLFVTKSVYDSYKVQDRLQVEYEVYTNDKGVEFPLVSLVTSMN